MFASSRIDKGTTQFKPLVKPRNSRAPAAAGSSSRQSSVANQASDQPSASPVLRNSILTDDGFEQSAGFSNRYETPVAPRTTSPVIQTGNVPHFAVPLPSQRSSTSIAVPSSSRKSPEASFVRATSIMPTRGSSIVPTRGSVAPTQTPAPSVAPSNTARTPFRSAPVGISDSRDRPSSSSAGPSSDRNAGTLESRATAEPTEPVITRVSFPNSTELLEGEASASAKGKGKGRAESETPAPKKARPKHDSKQGKTQKESETQSAQGTRTSPRTLRARKAPPSAVDKVDDNQDDLDSDGDDYEQPHEGEPKAKRKRKRCEGNDTPQAETDPPSPKYPPTRKPRQKKRSAITLLPSSEIPVDDDGHPLQIDPDTVTMAELCMDMGVGRPSSRTEESVTKSVEWKVQQRSVRQMVREKHKSRFLPNANTEGETSNATPVEGAEAEGAAARRLREVEEGGEGELEDGNEVNELDNLRPNRYAAQVRMDENGEIIMDDLTLSVDRYEVAAEEVPTGDYQVVEEAERDRFVNGHTWSKRLSGQRWSREETDLFYHYIGMWGTDFETIAHLLPRRTRREVRNKYNAEAKKDPRRLDSVFAHKVPVDLDELARATGLDFTGPPPEFTQAPASPARSASPPLFEDAFGPESSRASPMSAVSVPKKGKEAKTKKGRKGKKKGIHLAEDEEVIGSIPID